MNRAPILRDFQRLLRQLETSLADFQCALENCTNTADPPMMFQKCSKMDLDGLTLDAVLDAMMHRN